MRIRVATLNTWALPAGLAEHVPARMRAIGARLGALAVDAIAFQEVWTPRARAALIEAGRRVGLDHSWHSAESYAGYGGSGLLVLSRFPARRSRFERFALRGPPERLAQGDFYADKGFVHVELETPEGPVALLDTHLHARYPSRAPHEYRALRAGQVVQLAIAVNRIREPLIAAGDFNFQERDPGYRVLGGLTGLRDAAAALDRREATVVRRTAYRGGRKPDKRIDFVFVRDGVGASVSPLSTERVFDEALVLDAEPAAYSDHVGVLAEFDIAKGASRAPHTPNPSAVALARSLLSEGRIDAELRQRDTRVWAGAGLGCAAVAAAGLRGLGTTRRQLLRGALRAAAVLALAPSAGLSLLSEVYVPDELHAFEELEAELASLDPRSESIA